MQRPLLLVLFAASVVLTSTAGCGEASVTDEVARDTAFASIPFRKDGTLTFLKGGEPVKTIDVEVAATDSARIRGLMERAGLPENSGMLFLFEQEASQSFWMANTPLSLDIMFVDADSQIVNIAKYTKPFSSESVPSIDPARYVVETPAGFADTHGIVEGDRVTWNVQRP